LELDVDSPKVDEHKWPEYPWQLPIAERFPASRLSEAQRRRRSCEFFYDFELALLEEGLDSELVYDSEEEVFRFPDGRFALSREHADWPALKAVGYFNAWGL
jgi:hypothetical protein